MTVQILHHGKPTGVNCGLVEEKHTPLSPCWHCRVLQDGAVLEQRNSFLISTISSRLMFCMSSALSLADSSMDEVGGERWSPLRCRSLLVSDIVDCATPLRFLILILSYLSSSYAVGLLRSLSYIQQNLLRKTVYWIYSTHPP